MGSVNSDPITLEVVHNALLMSAMEMKGVAVRTAYSSLWKEAGDLSCGILTKRGEIVAQGLGDIPVHMASMPRSLQGCLAKISAEELEPGDILWQNDPYQGNNHLPDFFMAAPVFADSLLIGFAAVRGHYVDVGGMGPGSYSAITRDIHGEGVRIPPIRLYRRGELNHEILDIFLSNVRNPDMRMGDLRAQYAGCHTGRRSLERLAAKYGAQQLMDLMEEILNHSEALTRAQIKKFPPGRYEFVDYCDVQGEPIRIQVAVSISGDTLMVDFTGSDPEGPHGMNCPLTVAATATYYAVKCITDPQSPANSGCYRPIRIIAPEGSVVNCRYPRSVILGNHETAARIVDAILGALAPAIPNRVVAAGCGTSGPLVVAGRDPRERPFDSEFIWIETGGGGQGAALRKDGVAGTRVNVGNTGNTPIEAIEIDFPILNLAYELVQDTGGPGMFRGACALRRTFVIKAEQPVLTVSYEREHFAPYGLFGGQPGSPARFTLSHNGTTERIPSKTLPMPVGCGDTASVQCAGGGGVGDPRQRDPAFVLADVQGGYVSRAAAEDVYGVVLVDEVGGLRVDAEATRHLRSTSGIISASVPSSSG